MYDEEAVAAVNAAGLKVASGKAVETTNGYITAKRNHVVGAPLNVDQLDEGTIFEGRNIGVNRFVIDKDGNITLVGTVDGVDISGFKTVAICPADFTPGQEDYDWIQSYNQLHNRTSLTLQTFSAPVILPNGVTISKITLYGYRDDAEAEMSIRLYRNDPLGSSDLMAEVVADWTSGSSSGYDDTISYATIDNVNYTYGLILRLDPNDAVSDVNFTGVKIELA